MVEPFIDLTLASVLTVTAVGAPAIIVGVGAAVAVAAVGVGLYHLYSSRVHSSGLLIDKPTEAVIAWIEHSQVQWLDLSDTQVTQTANQSNSDEEHWEPFLQFTLNLEPIELNIGFHENNLSIVTAWAELFGNA